MWFKRLQAPCLQAICFQALFGLSLAVFIGAAGCGPSGETVAPTETQNESDYEAELAGQEEKSEP